MSDLFFKGGPLMWPILACSITAFTILLHKAWQYRCVSGQLSMPAREMRKTSPPVMQPLITALDSGVGERELALVGTRQVRRLERGLGTLSLVSVITPLLGLTGTVLGLIRAFQAISDAGSRVEPSLLAGGIWEALITTAAGLLVAITAHVAFHYLDSRMEEISLTMKETTLALAAEREHGV